MSPVLLILWKVEVIQSKIHWIYVFGMTLYSLKQLDVLSGIYALSVKGSCPFISISVITMRINRVEGVFQLVHISMLKGV